MRRIYRASLRASEFLLPCCGFITYHLLPRILGSAVCPRAAVFSLLAHHGSPCPLAVVLLGSRKPRTMVIFLARALYSPGWMGPRGIIPGYLKRLRGLKTGLGLIDHLEGCFYTSGSIALQLYTAPRDLYGWPNLSWGGIYPYP